MTVEETQNLAANIKNIREVAIFDCNHMLPIEVPEAVSEKLLQHLAKTEPNPYHIISVK